MFRPHNIPKLATKEDPLHIHKTLGVICLANYGYRFYLLLVHGTMNLDNSTAIILLGCHAALSTSSLVFHIPSVRNPKAPMIYPEYRLHSILFVWRSVVCFLLTYYGADTAYRYAACMATMILADTITSQFSTTNKTTTMRNMPFDNTIGDELQRRITRMQSAQQIGATLYMLGNLDSCFSPMLAIQIAAFLMTLVRKNIIDSTAWHTVYNMSLWINIFCFWSLPLEYIVIQPFMNYGLYYWRFSFTKNSGERCSQELDRQTHQILGNKYLGLTAAYLVFRSGVGEKMAIIIRGVGNLDAIVRNAIILAYIAAQIVNLTPRRRM